MTKRTKTWNPVLCGVGGAIFGYILPNLISLILVAIIWGAFVAPYLARKITYYNER